MVTCNHNQSDLIRWESLGLISLVMHFQNDKGLGLLRATLRGTSIAMVGCEDLGQSIDLGHSEPGCPFPERGDP